MAHTPVKGTSESEKLVGDDQPNIITAAGDQSFSVDLQTLNNSGVSGTANLSLSGTSLTVSIAASGLDPNMPHPQHIHGLEGGDSMIPDSSSDADGDGFIELLEALPDYGPILVPLTSPPGGELSDFPTAPDGNIDFTETYTFDLTNVEDQMTFNSLLPLQNREIVLHGDTLEEGDGANGGEADGTAGYKATLPIATGEIENDNGAVQQGDTLIGLGGSDYLIGAGGDDVLFDKEGDDVMFGADGNDKLVSGEGNDSLYGGNGDDRFDAQQGDDLLHGGAGNDSMYGAAGDDMLHGDMGNDTVHGASGDDEAYGGEGDDVVHGASGFDTLHGGDGNDLLFGGEDDDVINGDAGDDRIRGDEGDDMLGGGEGADRFDFFDNSGNDVITDFETSDLILIQGNVNDSGLTSVQQLFDSFMSEEDGGTTINLGSDHSIFLQDVEIADLQADSFFVTSV
ncbi:MAG: hypothetical protein MK052_09515 [Alphaproteobacteria bacterium]|nr:hypothetical protein [Alphaproteobacteria bacterium]